MNLVDQVTPLTAVDTASPDTILLIGGTDPSGAGLQTDWRIINALQIPAYSVVTAVTAQNAQVVSTEGVLTGAEVQAQLDSVLSTLQQVSSSRLAAVKIGMLGNEQVVDTVAAVIPALCRLNEITPTVILDPVIRASSGKRLLTERGQQQLCQRLLPLVDLVTPNVPELNALTGLSIKSMADIEQAARVLLEMGVGAVLVKGGHFAETSAQSSDYFVSAACSFWLSSPRWKDRHHVRGTGCLFASAVACALAQRHVLSDGLVLAKALLSQAIRTAQPFDGVCRPGLGMLDVKDWSLEFQDLPWLSYAQPNTPRPEFVACATRRLGIYPVVDSARWVRKLVGEGVETIQLRIKAESASPEQIEQEIIAAIRICQPKQIRLFINDHWQLAIKHGAYGVHLGQEDLHDADLQAIAQSACHLGMSTHCYTEVARALWVNPTYIALGPVYATSSKQMPWVPQGVDGVERWVKLLGEHYPLVAIGGIDLSRAKDLLPTGVGSVAMISLISQAANYPAVIKQLSAIWD